MCTPCFVVTCAAAEEIFKSKMNVHFQNSNIRNMEFVWFTKPRQKCHAISKYNEAGHGSIFHSQVFSGFVSSLNHDIYNCKWVQHKSKIFNANFTISLQMQVLIFLRTSFKKDILIKHNRNIMKIYFNIDCLLKKWFYKYKRCSNTKQMSNTFKVTIYLSSSSVKIALPHTRSHCTLF